MIMYLLIITSCLAFLVNGQFDKSPPIGWHSGKTFGCAVTEEDIVTQSERMIELKLNQIPGAYVIIGDCWQMKERDANGRIQLDKKKFPHGLEYLVNFLHRNNMKLGLSSSIGPTTCNGRPGSQGHEQHDADSYAQWNIDYVLYDDCNLPASQNSLYAFAKMGKALNRTGKDIFFAIDNGGKGEIASWQSKIADSYRTVEQNKDGSHKPFKEIMMSIMVNKPVSYQGAIKENREAKGYNVWKDPGYLVIGDPSFTYDEQYTQFALWAITKSPLIANMDWYSIPPKVTPSPKELMPLVRLNQNPLTKPAHCIKHCFEEASMEASVLMERTTSLWAMDTGDPNLMTAIIVNYRSKQVDQFAFSLQELGFIMMEGSMTDVTVTDVSDPQTILDIHTVTDLKQSMAFKEIPAHGVRILQFRMQPYQRGRFIEITHGKEARSKILGLVLSAFGVVICGVAILYYAQSQRTVEQGGCKPSVVSDNSQHSMEFTSTLGSNRGDNDLSTIRSSNTTDRSQNFDDKPKGFAQGGFRKMRIK